MHDAAVVMPRAATRTGAAYWLHSYWIGTRWHLAGLRMWLSLLTVIQILAGTGFVLGIGLFFSRIPPSAALFVCTGIPVINLVMVGLIFAPQLVADQKLQQSYDFLRALPLPETATACAWYTVCLLAGLPAVLVSLLVAEARYSISLTVVPAVVPAVLLTAFTGTMIGYALGHAVASPMATRLTTQLFIFGVFGFTPILYPARQLPRWLASLNWWLPFGHMAAIVRAGLTTGLVAGIASSYVIVTVWGLVGVAVSAWALGRRG